MCAKHYLAAWRAGLPPLVRVPDECAEDGCERDASARGLCHRHYANWRKRHLKAAPLADLYPRVERIGWDVTASGCWEWRGGRDAHQYGSLSNIKVHRIVYAHHHGQPDPGMSIRHTCDNPPCINPDHLVIGTHGDNMRDVRDRGRHWQQQKTHCPKGHPLIEGNLAEMPNPTHRKCLTCARDRAREQARLIREAHRLLGLTQTEYRKQYGHSPATAAAILAEHGVTV